MTVLSDYITRMVDAGMSQDDAVQIVAEIFAAGVANAAIKSTAADRQKRYRERKKTVTKRNESVTERNADTVTQNVTNRNETVTPLRSAETPISYLLTSSDNLEKKKESKKERSPKKRYGPLPDNWQPSLGSYRIAEQHGVNAQLVEQIFRDYLKSSGKLYADYDAAFNNFLRNQRNFGNVKHGTPAPHSGSLTASLRRELAELEQSEGADFALPAGRILRISN